MAIVASNKKRFFFDMDGVVARFHDHILDEEGQVQIERMYEPEFFRDLEPFQNMVDGLSLFMKIHPDLEIFSLSAAELGNPPGFVKQKDSWLLEFLPEINNRIFSAIGENKADFIPGGIQKDDFLLDDYNKNLREWEAAGGKSIKCINNINQRGLGKYGGDIGNMWEGASLYNGDSPKEICNRLEELVFGREKNFQERYLEFSKDLPEELQNWILKQVGDVTFPGFLQNEKEKEEFCQSYVEKLSAWLVSEPYSTKTPRPIDEPIPAILLTQAMEAYCNQRAIVVLATPEKEFLPPVEITVAYGDLSEILDKIDVKQSTEEFLEECESLLKNGNARVVYGYGDQIRELLEREQYEPRFPFHIENHPRGEEQPKVRSSLDDKISSITKQTLQAKVSPEKQMALAKKTDREGKS